jgi:glycosyltransferase involved in cell wall biosynthesis
VSQTLPVTVVIPTFNAAKHLRGAIRSLHSQTRGAERIVVVDDGSTDETVSIARSSGVEVIEQSGKGLGAARNRGLELAESEFVTFCNARDWYVPDKLAYTIDVLEKMSAVCSTSDVWVVRGDSVEGRKNEDLHVPSALTFEYLLQANPIACSSVVARRSAVLATGGFEEMPGSESAEDYDMWLRLAREEPLAYSARPMTFCRELPHSAAARAFYLKSLDEVLLNRVDASTKDLHIRRLVSRGRAAARLRFARQLMRVGVSDEVRDLVKDAQQLAPSWSGWKMRLRLLFH